MINVQSTLVHMNISHTSITNALQALRGRLGRAESIQAGAAKFIHDLLDVDVKFTNVDRARITAFAVLEKALQLQCQIPDADEVMIAANERAEKFLADPINSWMFARQSELTPVTAGDTVAVVDGLETKVEVRADGKIKKGGKQILANEMYVKLVIESAAPISNTDFVKELVSKLGMTTAGARTYAYNAAKAHKQSQA